jgi:hypothetical protein
MAARVQGLVLGLGKAKQTSITAASASFLRFKKSNMDLTSPGFMTETDAAEIGKGNEFISQVFPVAQEPGGRIDKFCSAEYLTWLLCYALGNVVEASAVYTILPIDPGTTLELPYFSWVEQVAEGGGAAIDNLFIGNALEDFTLSFNSGVGRSSATVTANWVGSGNTVSPSAIVVPAVQVETGLLSQMITVLTINGVDYVAAKTTIDGTLGWKNNMTRGYFPGSGIQNGAGIAGRIEIGARVPTFTFTVRLLSTSLEYAKLIAQTTGTATITFQFDSTHLITFLWQSVSFETVTNKEANGIVAVGVTVAPKFAVGPGLLTVTAQCGVTGIGQ